MLAVCGDLTEDIVVWLDEPLRPASDTACRIFRRAGGSATNVALAASRLVRTRLITCLGEDRTGDELAETIQRGGVDLRVQRRGRTGTIVILVQADGERHMMPDRGAAELLETIPDEWLADVDHLHAPFYGFTSGSTAASLTDAMRSLADRGGRTSIDASSWSVIEQAGVDRFVGLVDELAPTYLFANTEEAAALGLGPDGTWRPRASTVVVKNGADPTCVITADGDRIVVPVAPVEEVVDRTGAGDAFAAGFLAATLAQASLEDACREAHRAAAEVLRHPGGSALEIPDRE